MPIPRPRPRRPSSCPPARGGDRGQASVELLGILPAVGLLVALVWQALLCGHAVWMVGMAARGGARAAAVGAPVTPRVAALLPSRLERGLEVRRVGEDRAAIRVEVRLPSVLPGVRLPIVGATARLEAS